MLCCRYYFRQKRRSSFVRGRKSLGTGEFDNAANSIPVELPAMERHKLICLENSLRQLKQEFPELAGIDQFVVQARTEVKEKLKDLAAERRKLNPVNQEIDRQLTALPLYIDKLKAEKETWDNMVKSRQLLAETAEELSNTVDANPIVDESTLKINASDRALLDSKPDYELLYQEVWNESKIPTDAMQQILDCILQLDARAKGVETSLAAESKRLYKKSFPSADESSLLFKKMKPT